MATQKVFEIPVGMRRVYRRFERWRKAHPDSHGTPISGHERDVVGRAQINVHLPNLNIGGTQVSFRILLAARLPV
jgi:hypothetical protein